MAKITEFKGYDGPLPEGLPLKPDVAPNPIIVDASTGAPVVYPGCHGVGVRAFIPQTTKRRRRTSDSFCFTSPHTSSSSPALTRQRNPTS